MNLPLTNYIPLVPFQTEVTACYVLCYHHTTSRSISPFFCPLALPAWDHPSLSVQLGILVLLLNGYGNRCT